MAIKKVLYSGVVLDSKTVHKLYTTFHLCVPLKWKVLCHHMTICLGELPENLKHRIGESVELKIISIGSSNRAIAFGVEGFYSFNEKPHITLAIDHDNGAKPKESNDIIEWREFPFPITITGVVTEITN